MNQSITTFAIRNYDLDATLNSGQAFRWTRHENGWVGVIGSRWVRLASDEHSIIAQAAVPVSEWDWLVEYLQLKADLDAILLTFPQDTPLQEARLACRGLRLLRQNPWECLASFILSSTKQIVQIQQIIALLCETYGEPVPGAAGHPAAYSFPTAERLARATEAGLRGCKMGFRAPYLLETARAIAAKQFDLERIGQLPLALARDELTKLPGVGRKIADCVLLFAYNFPSAFPVDVWVMKGLRQLYFPRRRVGLKELQQFAETYFGPNAGYAQQYLFHFMRTNQARSGRRSKSKRTARPKSTRLARTA